MGWPRGWARGWVRSEGCEAVGTERWCMAWQAAADSRANRLGASRLGVYTARMPMKSCMWTKVS